MSVCYECCVLSGRGLCDELITRPEESYRLSCVVVCDQETSWMRGPWPSGGLSRQKQTLMAKGIVRWTALISIYKRLFCWIRKGYFTLVSDPIIAQNIKM
jgi:hypothetical protein